MKRFSLPRVLSLAVPVCLFMLLIFWLITGVINTQKAVEQDALDNVKTTIENGVTMCYAIEGAYPESVDYLRKNYGVVIDSSKYIVHYECFAANIRPTITIIERRQKN